MRSNAPKQSAPTALVRSYDLPGGAATASLIADLEALAPISGGVAAVATPEFSQFFAFGRSGPFGPPLRGPERFQIGSISKSMAALLAARLIGEGRLYLDTPVRSILPWLELPAGADDPTIAHLLTHTTGWIAGNDALPGELGQILGLAGTRAGSAPGSFFHYSNIGYVVLGAAIAQATGQPFHAALRELVLEPLGMGGAFANVTGAERSEIVPGTVPTRDDAEWRPGAPLSEATWAEPAGADGNVAASAADLLRFTTAITDPAGVPGAGWLPAAVALLGSELAPGGEEILTAGRHLAITEARYGLGVNIETSNAGGLLTHGGGMIGHGAFMIAHESRGIAVSVLVSGPGERPYAELLARAIHASALESASNSAQALVDVSPGLSEPVAALHPARPPLRRGVGPREGLTGTFRSYSPWFPHLEIGVNADDELVLRAYAGVEAPTDDVPLVANQAEPLRFRIGGDSRLPESITFGGIVDGIAQTLERDGCRYARVAERTDTHPLR